MLEIGEEDILKEDGCEDGVDILGGKTKISKVAGVEVLRNSVKYLCWYMCELHG